VPQGAAVKRTLGILRTLARRLSQVSTRIDKRVRRSLRRFLQKPHRFNARTPYEAAGVLARLASAAPKVHPVAVVSRDPSDPFTAVVRRELQHLGVRFREVEARSEQLTEIAAASSCVVAAAVDSQTQFEVGRRLLSDPRTAALPYEYVALPRLENNVLASRDPYVSGDFVSPMLSRHGQRFYEIYEKSLLRFPQKTDIRDYVDLAQLLESIVARGIPGCVAEFGSYQGHSGYLISLTLEALGSDKSVFMFDMFENFPDEPYGVDRFWSGSHKVDFATVRGRFADRPSVRLVKGDFTQTLAETDVGVVSLAFIDCDSYRATRDLLEQIWESRLSVGGIVAMEDYGHAALLGNRLAVHEFFDDRRDAFTWFSQFSGFFVAVKLPSTRR
jgi:hypothetical protein